MKHRAMPIKPFGLMIEAPDAQSELRDLDVAPLRQLIVRSQLLILRGFQGLLTANDLTEFCAQWGEISLWPFGAVLELVEHLNPEDHIFDHNAVPLHWDGMYRPQVPELQIFHCLEAPGPGQGGRTTFSNTLLALKNANPETRALWLKGTGHYKRKMAFYDSETISPLIDLHPLRDVPVIRYQEPPAENGGTFLNPPTLNFTGYSTEELPQLHQSLRQALYAPGNFYAHDWQKGDVVIADNFSLLHGREAFTSKAPRHLRRVHVLSDPPVSNSRLVSHK